MPAAETAVGATPRGVVAGTFTDPVGYSPWVLALAVLAAVLVLLWYAGLLGWSRAQPETPYVPLPPDSVQALRARCLAAIDDIERGVHAGTLSRNAAYEQLSATVRRFVGEVTGLPLSRMTLSDVRTSGLPRLPHLLELIYPLEFGPGDHVDPTPTLRAARELVATWS